jgi:zinc transport system ATP-binding protein
MLKSKDMDKNENILSVANLKVKFDRHLILNNISFDVQRDNTLAIIGPNGAGKTVLLRAILGLIPHEGQVNWASDIKIGYVPQKLFVGKDIPLTVSEFLHLKEKSFPKVREALEQVGLGESSQEEVHRGVRLLKTRLGALSGGELQRALIAFAILGNPNVLLFDEPTSGVDISGEETVYSLISKLKKEKDLTIIFISHELDIVYKYADHVLCLNKEALCFGPPKKVIDKESLEALYGEEVHFYHHDHHGK